RIPEFLAWTPSDLALQNCCNLRKTPYERGYAATQNQTARCTRVAPAMRHPRETVARQKPRVPVKELPDREARRPVRERPDKSQDTRCSSNWFCSLWRSLADCKKHAICSVRRNG